MQVFAFIDTNVLLHFRFFRDVDWAGELKVPELTIVLAPLVLEELDKKKWSGSRREKDRAARTLKALKELGLSTAPVDVRPAVRILALDTEPNDAMFTRERLNTRSADDRLLMSALSFKAACGVNDRVLVLTDDTGLSIKAPRRQMEVAAPSEHLALVDEPDETERELEAAKRELAAIKSAAPKVRATLAGDTWVEVDLKRVKSFDDRTMKRLLDEWRSRHPYARPTEGAFEVLGERLSLKGFDWLPGFVSVERAASHNRAVDECFAKYDQYLRDWPAHVNRFGRCVKFTFTLENLGTAPADDLHVRFWTDADGVWLEELPDLPEPPTMPKPRDPLDIAIPSIYERMPYLDSIARDVDRDLDGPNIVEANGGDPQRVSFRLKRLTHHVPVELPAVYFHFSRDDSVRSFRIDYHLVAANIREPQRKSLHAQLTVLEPVEPLEPGVYLADRDC